MLNVEIVRALAHRSAAKMLQVPCGASIADALTLAAADPQFHGVDLANAAVGIYGKVASREQLLQDGDRIEIYRPLLEEPKLARRKRAGGRASKSDRS
jgi:uncharacterized protein